jgi:hypothetical protein
MVTLDAVVGVLLGAVPRGWDELVEHNRVGRRLVGGHLRGGDLGGLDGLLEESAGRRCVTP